MARPEHEKQSAAVARRSYVSILDAIGLYLEYRQATDVLVNEIEGGFLLGFLVGNEQRVVTLGDAELTALQAEASRFTCGTWSAQPGERPGLRVRLHYLGRYLDSRGARAIVLQERPHGFSLEYTGVPLSDLSGLARLYESMDDGRLSQAPA